MIWSEKKMGALSEKELYVENQKLKILMLNLFTSMPSTSVSSLILTAMLWSFVPKDMLLLWFFSNNIFVLVRYLMIGLFRKGVRENDIRFWKTTVLISFVITGFLLSSSALFHSYVPFEYLVFIYFILGGMVAGSVGSYHNNLLMFNAYALSVFLLPTLIILQMESKLTSPMAIMGVIFYLISSINAKRLNYSLNEFLELKFDNNKLVDQTAKLNMDLISTNQELKELSLIDPLTKLKNRRFLYDVFADEIVRTLNNIWLGKTGIEKRAMDHARGYGIMVIDIDHFKEVNDNHGHHAGDKVLEQFAERLKMMVRSDDVICRIGGEEFVVILKNTDPANTQRSAEKIRNSVRNESFNIPDTKIDLTCTIGVVNYPFFANVKEVLRFDQAILLADKALYHGKNNGRNQCVYVSSPIMESSDVDEIKKHVSELNSSFEKGVFNFSVISG